MFLSLKLIMGHEWKPRNYFWGYHWGSCILFLNFSLFVCVFIRSTIELTYFHTPKPSWHSPVGKLKRPPHRCKAMIDSRVYKQVHPQTDNQKGHGFFFLCFLFLQCKRKCWGVGGGERFRQTLCNKNTTKPWPRKSTTKRCCRATPRTQGCFLFGSHLESRHAWPF